MPRWNRGIDQSPRQESGGRSNIVRGLRGRLRREGVEYDFSGHMSSLAVIRAAHSEFREGRENECTLTPKSMAVNIN